MTPQSLLRRQHESTERQRLTGSKVLFIISAAVYLVVGLVERADLAILVVLHAGQTSLDGEAGFRFPVGSCSINNSRELGIQLD